MYFDFANILVFFLVGLGFILLNLGVAWVLRPKGPQAPGKVATYECGEPTIGQAWVRFDIRFYAVALMFVVFDIEIALLFPWAVVFREMTQAGEGWIAFLEVGTFIAVLMAGLVYVWARRDLDWTGPGSPAPNVESSADTSTPTASPTASAPATVGQGGPIGAPR